VITPPESPLWAGACWPVPAWNGEKPQVSDGFARNAVKDPKTGKQKHRQHLGVDIMFRNRKRAKPDLPVTTAWYHCASDVPMLAALAGKIFYASQTSRGMTVQIDHGNRYGFPLVSYYTHMSALNVRKGQEVIAGDVIGTVGNDPSTQFDPNHCHFELWDFSRGNLPRVQRCIDPMPYLKVFAVIEKRRLPSGRFVTPAAPSR
jgi:murein DD-endopeptidase MepM/ murein hydrolase activator NlpD